MAKKKKPKPPKKVIVTSLSIHRLNSIINPSGQSLNVLYSNSVQSFYVFSAPFSPCNHY